MKRRVLACALLLAFAGPAAAVDDGGTQSPFVLGTGAREQAMGRTGAATSCGADALFWNAARLGTLNWPELSVYHTQLFVDDVVYHAGLFTWPTLDFGTLAVGYQRLDVSGIESTDERNRQLGSIDAGESNLLLGYGRGLGPLVAVGGALRIAQQSLGGQSDVGVGLDLGLSVEYGLGGSGAHRLALGANLQNAVRPKLHLAQDEVADPRSLKLGLGYTGGTARLSWVAAFDTDFPQRADPRAGAGLELVWAQLLSLRAGVDDAHPTFGVGVGYRGLRFDYGMRTDDVLSRNDRFTLALRFGSGVTARREARLVERQHQVSEELAQRLQQREQEERVRAQAQADAAFRAGGFEEALRLYRRVLALAPDDAGVRSQVDAAERRLQQGQADQALAAGNAAQAATAYQEILEHWPGAADAERGLAAARAELRRSADRERSLAELLKEALARFAAGDLPAAETTLQELLRIAPAHELGSQLLQSVRAARAQRGAESLATARARAQAGEWDAGLDALRQAERLLGRRADLDALEAQWSARRLAAGNAPSRPGVPEDTAPRHGSRQPSAAERAELDRLYRDGLDSFRRGDFDAAIRDWHVVWMGDPEYQGVGDHLIKAYLFEGVELYSRGEYEAALDRCRRVLEIDPANEKAHRYLDRIGEEETEVREIGEPHAP
jgi:tetratricopeptide (TPR) repeat protein